MATILPSMDLNMPNMPAVSPAVALVMILIVSVIGYAASRRPYSREPPYLLPRIPVIGHVMGILTYGVPYYAKIAWVVYHRRRDEVSG